MDMDLMEHQPLNLLVTGGAGFIGANFIHYWLARYPQDEIVNLDALTYAGNLENLRTIEDQQNYQFVHGNILDEALVDQLTTKVDMIVHFAAESHVDRSILTPDRFLQTNVIGTHVLLKAALKHKVQRFHHISTDEVFGTLELGSTNQFDESTPYDPRSPYSASKAGSDHLVRAYGETYGLNYTITNCSNNYGEYQFPEKLFSLAITNLIEGKNVPVYGKGDQVRDWLYVQDHCRAIELVLLNGQPMKTYLVGGLSQDISNLSVIKLIIELMQESEDKIKFIQDRPGHDVRYSVNWQSIHDDLGWSPTVTLEDGLKKTISWYQQNTNWWQPLKDAAKSYYQIQYQSKKSR